MSSSATPSHIIFLLPQPLHAMAPQRTRASTAKGKRRNAAPPAEDQDAPGTIAFAPAITPGTFFNPPPIEDPTAPAESLLFPDTTDAREESPAPPRPSRGGHAKKKPEDHVPRPANSFILFRSAFIRNQHVTATVETNHSTLSSIIGCTWKGLPKKEKAFWNRKAKMALEEHKRKFPEYTFRPEHKKGKAAPKRKVREVGPKDTVRCETIAALLNKGYKGKDLEEAIAEFDRNRVPEIVTRFEAPITAGNFRRGSSAPLPVNADAPARSDKAAGKKKARATSSQPGRATEAAPAQEAKREAQFDFDDLSESEGSFCTTPSSPYPTTPISETNSSFDFSSFSFAATTPPPQMQHCDPLSVLSPLDTQFDAPYVFSPEPSPLLGGAAPDVFAPLHAPYAAPPQQYYEQQWSPLSSMPSTPGDVAPMYLPTPSPASFEPHFAFYAAPPAPAHAHAHAYDPAAYPPPHFDALTHQYAMHAKQGYACFDGQPLVPFEAGGGLSPPYPPAYAM
ncbi:HMG domain-containing protein [Phanerochaete sordida]|uniref:HMG domain-containing protein n=1 Tax=Phanerochaete sordida TaxID=48140 RepID=A0A9P3L7W9_9APHY|nr:HMG domain-containing protein [Phanerochaete sordida]